MVMAVAQKLKYFGYLDYCTAVSQITVSFACTLAALYYYYAGDRLPYFAPTLNLSITAIVLFVNGGQIICAKELLKPRTDVSKNASKVFENVFKFICVAEMKRIKHHWSNWNRLTLLVDFIWLTYFTTTTFIQQSWPLAAILISFLVTVIIRLTIACGIRFLKMDPVQIPVVYVVPPNETCEIRNQN